MRRLRNITGATVGLEACKGMKTRILAAMVLVPLLFVIVLAAPKIIFAILFGVLMAVGVYEMLYRTALVAHPRLVAYSAVMAFGLAMWSYFGAVNAYLLLALCLFFMLLFSEILRDHVKVRVEMLGMCFLAGFVVPFLLSSLIRILGVPAGRYYILVPFLIAFLSDAGAYFAGMYLGRHKLAPVISPNKTVEGVVGGVIFAVLAMMIYGGVLALGFKLDVHFGVVFLYGLAGSLIGVFGDLCFSAIKRQTGIKDYGYLIPGHGGFFDRFDSMVLVAPFLEAMLMLLPFAE